MVSEHGLIDTISSCSCMVLVNNMLAVACAPGHLSALNVWVSRAKPVQSVRAVSLPNIIRNVEIYLQPTKAKYGSSYGIYGVLNRRKRNESSACATAIAECLLQCNVVKLFIDFRDTRTRCFRLTLCHQRRVCRQHDVNTRMH